MCNRRPTASNAAFAGCGLAGWRRLMYFVTAATSIFRPADRPPQALPLISSPEFPARPWAGGSKYQETVLSQCSAVRLVKDSQ